MIIMMIIIKIIIMVLIFSLPHIHNIDKTRTGIRRVGGKEAQGEWVVKKLKESGW